MLRDQSVTDFPIDKHWHLWWWVNHSGKTAWNLSPNDPTTLKSCKLPKIAQMVSHSTRRSFSLIQTLLLTCLEDLISLHVLELPVIFACQCSLGEYLIWMLYSFAFASNFGWNPPVSSKSLKFHLKKLRNRWSANTMDKLGAVSCWDRWNQVGCRLFLVLKKYIRRHD